MLENVVKHRKVLNENTIKATIFIDKSRLTITNGKSKSQAESTSFGTGLENKTRYKLLTEKEVFIKNLENRFSVSIPIINLDV